jgi:DNA-binding winged helix-turn-helix (wHTH) protein
MTVETDECRFCLLGPVQVVRDGGPVEFSRRQQRDLLALLLLHVDRVVPVDQIVDAMWGAAVPATAGTQIKNMVSALRRVLTDGERALASIDRHPAGYRMQLVPVRHSQLRVRHSHPRLRRPEHVLHHFRVRVPGTHVPEDVIIRSRQVGGT